jgi:hypothetical protein
VEVEMYKKLISSMLIVALLHLMGCTTFQNLSKEEQKTDFPLEQYSIKIILNNGESIHSNAYLHTIIREPSDFVVGSGMIYQNTTEKTSEFKGKIFRHQIDSSKHGEQYFIYWLNDNSRVFFLPDSSLDIKPEFEDGLWINKNGSYQKINFDEILEIEIPKINAVLSILAGLVFTALVVLLFVFVGQIGIPSVN